MALDIVLGRYYENDVLFAAVGYNLLSCSCCSRGLTILRFDPRSAEALRIDRFPRLAAGCSHWWESRVVE